MNVNKINPAVLIFDLDETLFVMEEEGKEAKGLCLSSSAQNLLSAKEKDPRGVKKLKIKVKAENNYQDIHFTVRAIAREEIKNIFSTIEVINNSLKANIIQVKVITSAVYPKKTIMKLFDFFYAENQSNKFSTGVFPIEYFNRKNYKDQEVLFESILDSPIKTKDNTFCRCKFDLVTSNYKRWSRELPGLTKERVLIIDNADFNLWSFKDTKFRALHYATTPDERLDDKTFTKEFQFVMSEINKLIEDTIIYPTSDAETNIIDPLDEDLETKNSSLIASGLINIFNCVIL